MIHFYDALVTVTYWIITGAERAQIAASDRRNAIALRQWDAVHSGRSES